MFERIVDIAVWEAFKVDLDSAPALTDQIQSVRSKLIMIENVVEKQGATRKELGRLRSFRQSIEGITRERNRLVHDPHLVNQQNQLIAYRGIPVKKSDLPPGSKERLKFEHITEQTLRDFMDRADRHHEAYVALYTEIFARVGISSFEGKPPSKPPPK